MEDPPDTLAPRESRHGYISTGSAVRSQKVSKPTQSADQLAELVEGQQVALEILRTTPEDRTLPSPEGEKKDGGARWG